MFERTVVIEAAKLLGGLDDDSKKRFDVTKALTAKNQKRQEELQGIIVEMGERERPIEVKKSWRTKTMQG